LKHLAPPGRIEGVTGSIQGEAAVEDLFRRHWGSAYRAAYLVVQDSAAAEDIAQEAMLAAVGRIDRFDSRRPFGPWLHRIVVNRSIDWVRARKRRGEVSADAAAELEDPGSPDGDRLPDDLLAALAKLDPEDRAVVVLRHLFDYDSTEIARMLGVPPATVRTRLRRALGRLRPLLVGRGLVLAILTAVLAVAMLTPPGRAALNGAADLIGQIGGTPTPKDDRGLNSTVPPGRPGSPVVVDNGEAPDGSRYEWVAYRRHERGLGQTFCVTFGWAGVPRRTGTGGCGSLGSWSPGVVGLGGRLIRPAEDGGARDYMVKGGVDHRAGRVRMIYRRPRGGRYEMPVDIGQVEGKLLERAGGDKPFTVLTAFVPAELVAEDRLDERYKLMSLSVVDPTSVMSLPYSPAYKRCVRRHGGFYARGWIDVILYDRQDRRIATLATRTFRPRIAACKDIPMMPANGILPAPKIVKTPAFKRLQRAFPPQYPRP
jgi:RNA polymerase sigma-70 factor, ECF subfamily